ncbi:hypothetical protein [Anaeromassilibacillus senegalensis]|uniref:Glycerophosphoryl diester phosphodiesterase membrane domain-containing protein n=1 Tax=Anaeromassilibacillus senegalensis TaxID=1673717 RepID=A0ABS9CMJ3_9FIRM|nr:hypothetical protein [Anaeromassilibacillus senegalensis]MCF2652361.1 hypothetical protein [Anaeromassilibacillus senegalensis]
MYCIYCGKKLADDGTPCTCRAPQPVQPPRVQPPAATQPKPIVPQPEPVAPQPEPVVPQPEPVVPQPEPVVPQPKPVVPQPEPIAPQPEPVVPQPEPVVPQPEPVVPQPEPVAPQPEPIAPQPPLQQQSPYVVQSPYTQPSPYVQQPSPYVQQTSPYVQPDPYAQYGHPYQAPVHPAVQITPVHKAIKALAGSPLFLVGAILTSLTLVLSVIQAFIPVDYIHLISNFLQFLPMELRSSIDFEEIYAELYAAQSAGTVSTLISMIPTLIVSGLGVAALWITFASGCDTKSPLLKTSGLTILKVLQIIGLVGLGLLALMVVIGLVIAGVVFAMISSEVSSYERAMFNAVMWICISVLVIALIVLAVMIVYSIKVIGSLNAAKKAIDTGKAVKKASMFVAIVSFIGAAIGIFNLYGDFVLTGWFSLLTGICSVGTQIVFGICIIQFNKKIGALIEPAMPVQPYVGQR